MATATAMKPQASQTNDQAEIARLYAIITGTCSPEPVRKLAHQIGSNASIEILADYQGYLAMTDGKEVDGEIWIAKSWQESRLPNTHRKKERLFRVLCLATLRGSMECCNECLKIALGKTEATDHQKELATLVASNTLRRQARIALSKKSKLSLAKQRKLFNDLSVLAPLCGKVAEFFQGVAGKRRFSSVWQQPAKAVLARLR